MSGLTYEYVLKASLCRPAHCSDAGIEARESQIDYIEFAPGYAEPGYEQPKRGILLGDWNYFATAATDILERMGYDCQWEDEWTTCSECGRAIRTQPDCYEWQPSHFEGDGEILCRECVDMETYLETLEDNPHKAFNDHADVSEYGYERIEDGFENGFHPGQNDNPEAIFARLKEQGITRILFVVDSVRQFDTRFSVWRKTE